MNAVMIRILIALTGLAGWVPGCAAAPVDFAAVDFVNASRPTRCAEEDNVYVKLLGSEVTAFRLSAEHPPYIAGITTDSTAPDFGHCDMSQDPVFYFEPRTVVLYEDTQIRLVGHTFKTFWRPNRVDFHIDGRNEPGLHLVQLLRRGPSHDVELLVVYPADGYWRLKPLPPASLIDTAYGSSFLFGPIEEDVRPHVSIRSITFEPATLTFRLKFSNAMRGILTVAAASRERVSLALAIDPPLPPTRPFAALRSMYVTPAQADVAVASWPADFATRSTPVMEFGQITAGGVRFGRIEPSQHNLSAPDFVFDRFIIKAPSALRDGNGATAVQRKTVNGNSSHDRP